MIPFSASQHWTLGKVVELGSDNKGIITFNESKRAYFEIDETHEATLPKVGQCVLFVLRYCPSEYTEDKGRDAADGEEAEKGVDEAAARKAGDKVLGGRARPESDGRQRAVPGGQKAPVHAKSADRKSERGRGKRGIGEERAEVEGVATRVVPYESFDKLRLGVVRFVVCNADGKYCGAVEDGRHTVVFGGVVSDQQISVGDVVTFVEQRVMAGRTMRSLAIGVRRAALLKNSFQNHVLGHVLGRVQGEEVCADINQAHFSLKRCMGALHSVLKRVSLKDGKAAHLYFGVSRKRVIKGILMSKKECRMWDDRAGEVLDAFLEKASEDLQYTLTYERVFRRVTPSHVSAMPNRYVVHVEIS